MGEKIEESTIENPKIFREVKIHQGYIEWLALIRDNELIRSLGRMPTKTVGKYHYIYKNLDNDNTISLVELIPIHHCWEIYCLKGNLFDDIERFSTFEEAEEKIQEYLK